MSSTFSRTGRSELSSGRPTQVSSNGKCIYAAEVIKDVITVLNEVGVSSGNAVFAALTSEPFSWRLGKEKVKGFLELGVAKGWISVEDGPRNAKLYSTNK